MGCDGQSRVGFIIAAKKSQNPAPYVEPGQESGMSWPELVAPTSPVTLSASDEDTDNDVLGVITDNENTSEWVPINRYLRVASYKDSVYVSYVDDANLRPKIGVVHVDGGSVTTDFVDKDETGWSVNDDDHHHPSFIVDGNGYIHYWVDMHVYPQSNDSHLPAARLDEEIMWYMSDNPQDISSFTFMGTLDAVEAPQGWGWSYLYPFLTQDRVLLFKARSAPWSTNDTENTGDYTFPGGAGLSMYKWNGSTWTGLGNPPDDLTNGAGTRYGTYPMIFQANYGEENQPPGESDPLDQFYNSIFHYPRVTFDNKIVAIQAINKDFEIADASTILYGHSWDLGESWLSWNGDTLTTPISSNSIPGIPAQMDGGNHTGVDGKGNPYVSWTAASPSGTYQNTKWKYYDGSSWSDSADFEPENVSRSAAWYIDANEVVSRLGTNFSSDIYRSLGEDATGYQDATLGTHFLPGEPIRGAVDHNAMFGVSWSASTSGDLQIRKVRWDLASIPSIDSEWTTTQIGTSAGSTGIWNGIYQMQSSGTGIWGDDMDLQFVHKTTTGDFDRVVRVNGIEYVSDSTFTGLMVSEELDGTGEYMAVTISNYNGLRADSRNESNVRDSVIVQDYPVIWLWLKREGDQFTVYYGHNTVTEPTLLLQKEIAMDAVVYVGIVTGSGHSSTQTHARLSRYTEIGYSQEAAQAIENIGLEDAEPWEVSAIAWAVDSLVLAGQYDAADYINRLGVTVTPANWKDGTDITEVNSPEYLQGQGYRLLADDSTAIDLNYQPSTDRNENVTYIWKGRPINNSSNDNYLWGADDGTDRAALKLNTDENNWVSYIHANGLLGQYFSIDTTNIVSVTRTYDDTTRIYKDDTEQWEKVEAFDGPVGQDIHIGALDNNGTLQHYSSQLAEWFVVGDSTLDLSVWQRVMYRTDSVYYANLGSASDETAPTTPVIAYNSGSSTSLTFDITTPSTDANGIAHYQVDLDQTFNKNIDGGSTQFTVTGLSASTAYDVRLSAFDPSGNQSATYEVTSVSTEAAGEEFTEDFESGLVTPPFDTKNGANDPTFGDDPTEGGSNDVMISDLPPPTTSWSNIDRRSEIKRTGGTYQDVPVWHPNGTSWSYQFRIFVPSDHYCDPDFPELIAQWHHSNVSPVSGGPPLMIRIEDCEIKIKYRYQSTEGGSVTENTVASGQDLTLDSWNYFIVDVTWDYSGSGSVDVHWDDEGWPLVGDEIIDYDGAIGFNDGDDLGVNQEFGVYKWDFNSATDATTYKDNRASNCPACDDNRLFYYDDITIQEGLEF